MTWVKGLTLQFKAMPRAVGVSWDAWSQTSLPSWSKARWATKFMWVWNININLLILLRIEFGYVINQVHNDFSRKCIQMRYR
jgi:hypothetical protein